MRPELQKKVDRAIRLLKSFNGGGNEVIELAYSGGKDSDVILELAKMAGINFRAIYKCTTIDPRGTIAHVKSNGVEVMRPKETFFQLIARKGYPNPRARFCCDTLKEYKVLNKAVQGVRRAESTRRAKQYAANDPIICRIYGKKSNNVQVCLPILNWSDKDVSDFIAARGIKCHPLYYDEQGNFHVERRLGCIGCPLASKAKRIEKFKQYPRYVKLWIDAGKKFLDSHPDSKSAAKWHGNQYDFFFANLFCDKRVLEFFEIARPDLWGERIDTKKELEKYFNIKL